MPQPHRDHPDVSTAAVVGGQAVMVKLLLYIDDIGPARYEYAWVLRQRGEKLREIGERLGVSTERARQMVMRYNRRQRESSYYDAVY
jgi:hypothetical protein